MRAADPAAAAETTPVDAAAADIAAADTVTVDTVTPDAAAGLDGAMATDGLTDILVSLFGYLLMMSLTAIGGGVIMIAPDIHRYVVDVRHWLTGEDFAAAFTLAQAAPGPNVLYVTLIGLKAGGLAGALVATVAILLPPFLITLAFVRWSPSRSAGPVRRAVRSGLSAISIGLLAAGGVVLALAADTGPVTAVLTVIAMLVMGFTRVNPVWLIVVGAVVGIGLGL